MRGFHSRFLASTNRNSHRRCSVRKVFLKISQNSSGKQLEDNKKYSIAAVFLWFLRISQEHLFYRTLPVGYFQKFSEKLMLRAPLNNYVCISAHYCISRNIRPEVFYKIGAIQNFAKFTGKRLCQSLFFNKLAGLWLATF